MSALLLQDCHKKTIEDICITYKNDPGDLIKILHEAQTAFGYLPESVQRDLKESMRYLFVWVLLVMFAGQKKFWMS